jgi:Protein of unknown function (DUF1091)
LNLDLLQLENVQNAYIRFLEANSTAHNPEVMIQYSWIVKSSDPNVGVLSMNWSYFEEVSKERQTIKVFRSDDSSNVDLEHLYFSTTFDVCKFFSGAATNLITKVISQDFFRSLSTTVSCPYRKGFKLLSINSTYTDSLLPPVFQETRFIIELASVGLQKKTKKWIKLYTFQLQAAIKK